MNPLRVPPDVGEDKPLAGFQYCVRFMPNGE